MGKIKILLADSSTFTRILLANAEKTYCPNGKFVPDEMMDGLRALYQGSLDEGYAGTTAY